MASNKTLLKHLEQYRANLEKLAEYERDDFMTDFTKVGSAKHFSPDQPG